MSNEIQKGSRFRKPKKKKDNPIDIDSGEALAQALERIDRIIERRLFSYAVALFVFCFFLLVIVVVVLGALWFYQIYG